MATNRSGVVNHYLLVSLVGDLVTRAHQAALTFRRGPCLNDLASSKRDRHREERRRCDAGRQESAAEQGAGVAGPAGSAARAEDQSHLPYARGIQAPPRGARLVRQSRAVAAHASVDGRRSWACSRSISWSALASSRPRRAMTPRLVECLR